MIGNIFLVRGNNSRIFPAVIVHIHDNSDIVISQLRAYKEKDEKNVVDIGQPEGLKMRSVAITYRMEIVKAINLVKPISYIKEKSAQEIYKMQQQYVKNKKLHLELKDLKKKNSICKYNNENYAALEKRVSEITYDLGYQESENNAQHRPFAGFRVAPTTGNIKVYHGGR